MLIRFFIFIFITSILCSCIEEVNVIIPEQEKKIVINGFFSPDSLFQINLTKSKSVNESDDNISFIGKGTVNIYNKNELLASLDYTENGNYLSSTLKPVIGESYHVEAIVPGMKTAFADVFIPDNTPITKIDTAYFDEIRNDYGNFSEEKFYRTNVKFVDAPDNNYYLFNLEVEYNDSVFNPVDNKMHWSKVRTSYFIGNEVNFLDFTQRNDIKYLPEGILFNDLLFEGKTTEINFKLRITDIYYSLYIDSLKIFFNLYSITKDYYQYLISKDKYNTSSGNPFAEPVPVFSNITDGIGMVAAGSKSTDSIIIPKNVLQKFYTVPPYNPGDTIKVPPKY